MAHRDGAPAVPRLPQRIGVQRHGAKAVVPRGIRGRETCRGRQCIECARLGVDSRPQGLKSLVDHARALGRRSHDGGIGRRRPGHSAGLPAFHGGARRATIETCDDIGSAGAVARSAARGGCHAARDARGEQARDAVAPDVTTRRARWHPPWHQAREARPGWAAGQAAHAIPRVLAWTSRVTLALTLSLAAWPAAIDAAPAARPSWSTHSGTARAAAWSAGGVTGQDSVGRGGQLPAPVGLVNDFAHVISPDQAARITQIATDVRTKSRGEIAVVTLPDIGDRDPNDVGVALIRQWKIGKAGNPGDPTRNAGAVILVVPKETNSDGRGRCWITTGSGTEGFITDADAGDICRDATPDFRQRDYGAGIALLTYETAQRFAKEFNFTVDTTLAVAVPVAASQHQGGGIPPAAMFFLLLVVYVILSAIARRGGGRSGCLPIFLPFGGGWSGGGGGGWSGGGGGGGGGFGGFGGGGGTSGGGGGSSW